LNDRRYQVFVSSTFLDLKEERAAVVSALLQMNAFPAGMEMFPAADEDAWTLIKRVILNSDYYLLVIGGRYGSVDPSTELSFTEMEFDYAVQEKIPVMAFLHKDPDAIVLGKSEKDKETREKLEAFRAKVKARKHVKFWEGADSLEGQVALSFQHFRQTYPAVGWIRGDEQTSTESLGELNDLRKRLEEAEAQLSARQTGPPPGAEKFAQGEDLIDLVPVVKVRAQMDTIFETPTTFSSLLEEDLTWDDLFSAIGPELLNEAKEEQLQDRLDQWFLDKFRSREVAEIRRAATGEGRTVKSITGVTIKLSDDDFGTMIVQMRALGLVERSDKARSVRDTASYWTLTPFGDQHLTELRAIRRKTADPPEGEDRAE